METVPSINIDIFLNIRNSPLLTICASIQSRADYLVKNYKCFTEQTTDSFEKYTGKSHTSKWRNNTSSASINQKNKEHDVAKRPIIKNDINVNREFISILNKITHGNKEKLLIKIKEYIHKENTSVYIKLVWDMMLRCPDFQDIYIDIILLIKDNNILYINELEIIWKDYVLYKQWLPECSICLSVSSDESSSNTYDEFCEFVKWKKRANAAIRAFMLFELQNIIDNKLIQELTKYIITSISIYINDQTSTNALQIINCLLEQMLTIVHTLKIYKCEVTKKYIKEFVKNNEVHIPTFSPSNKFKFIDIIENLKEINLFRVSR